MKLSIIIPSRNELFLHKTTKDILEKATGEFELIVVLDGYWPKAEEIISDKRVHYIHFGVSHGMRAGINAAAAIAKGKYLMKTDGHCMFAQGFDEVLTADLDEDWVVIPRRYRLDPENWCWKDVGKPPVDYEFLSYPYWKLDEVGIHGTIWGERALLRNKPEFDIDDNMGFQGSCWCMHKSHFDDRLGGMSEVGYGTFIGEPQEIGNKTWLGGGRVIVNKKTWYAHLHKGKTYGRGYFFSKQEAVDGNAYSVDYWYNNRWADRKHDFTWLVEKFWPVPSWPEDRKLWTTKP